MGIKFIVNPHSGRGRGKKALNIINNTFKNTELDYDIETTSAAKEGITLAQQAVEDDYSTIVAVGGDGTLNEVVTGILRSKKPYPKLGLIPAGTGNNFARGLGIPLNLKKACRRLVNPKVKQVDIGQVNDRFFLNSLGIGLSSTVVDEANQNFKYIHGTIVYVLSALKVMPEYQSVELEIELEDGQQLAGEYLVLVIGNSKIYSNTLELIPEFKIDDGLLDLCLIEKMPKSELVVKFPQFLTAKHQELDEVLIKKIKGATIKLKDTDQFHVDGEIFTSNELKINILPQVLELII